MRRRFMGKCPTRTRPESDRSKRETGTRLFRVPVGGQLSGCGSPPATFPNATDLKFPNSPQHPRPGTSNLENRIIFNMLIERRGDLQFATNLATKNLRIADPAALGARPLRPSRGRAGCARIGFARRDCLI